MDKYQNIKFFEGLNSLRFFAAYLVVMHHAETIRAKYGLANLDSVSLFKNGGNAVSFFFVLSGFLITYLLLKERNTTQTISIHNFYLKRVLRIWPLYFLLVVLGTLLLPFCLQILHVNYEMPYTFGQTWYYFVFFLPGLVTFFFGHHFLEPLWSIGIEEVFYMIWAPLFKFFKRHIFTILCLVIALKVACSVIATYLVSNALFSFIVSIFSFEAMAIGGMGAYFVFHRKNPISHLWIYKKWVQSVLYALLLVFLALNQNIDFPIWNAIFKTPIISGLLCYCLFLYLIIGVSLADNSLIKLQNKFLSFLGEISYGIYMYHMLIVFAVILFIKNILINLSLLGSSLLFYIIVTVIVIAVSYLSKILFEDRFLNLKNRIGKISTTMTTTTHVT